MMYVSPLLTARRCKCLAYGSVSSLAMIIFYEAALVGGQQAKSLLLQKRETVDHKEDSSVIQATNAAHSHDCLSECQNLRAVMQLANAGFICTGKFEGTAQKRRDAVEIAETTHQILVNCAVTTEYGKMYGFCFNIQRSCWEQRRARNSMVLDLKRLIEKFQAYNALRIQRRVQGFLPAQR